MFYSQIILAKKGPLGKIWLAAHHGDKKLGRPQIFSTDIGKSVDSIVHPSVPLALRVSGHLLLGVVRIYSRQVKYVLHDCHEAMVQIQMAFAKPHESTNLAQPTTTTTANGGEIHIVPHFGEYVEDNGNSPRKGTTAAAPFLLDHITGDGFCLPFDLQQMSETELAEQWIVAEDDPEQDVQQQQQQHSFLMMDADTTINTSMASTGTSQYHHQPEEQQWSAFDPDAVMMEEEDQEAILNESKVSDIEVARAASLPQDSMTSDVTMRLSSISNVNDNASTTNNSALKPPVTPGGMSMDSNFPVMEDDDILPPPPDDDDDDLPPPPPDDNDEQDINISKDTAVTLADAGASTAASLPAIGGLDDTAEEMSTTNDANTKQTRTNNNEDVDEPPKKKAKRQPAGVLRARKCRKVIADWDDMELTNAHIKSMLRDTSDLVQQRLPHPADWEEEQNEELDEMEQLFSWIPKDNENTRVLRDFLGHSDRLWSRPSIADDGQLSAALLQVWTNNLSRVHGKDLPIPKDNNNNNNNNNKQSEDVEVARTQQDEDEDASTPAEKEANEDQDGDSHHPLPPPIMEDDEDQLPPPPMEDDEDFPPPPMEDEDEILPPPMWDEDGGGPSPADTSEVLDLGLVNALDRDLETEDGDDRQTMGSDLVSSNSKWHIHTVKVLSLLQRNMGAEDKADHLSYNSLAKKCSRRTASGVFFELLQLKTWDFIDLDQGESYGDITISPGVKFDEQPPTKESEEATSNAQDAADEGVSVVAQESTASAGSPATT